MSQIDDYPLPGVLSRVIAGQRHRMSMAAAEYWSEFVLPESEERRLEQLADRNRLGQLTEKEQLELDEFLEVIELMDLLKVQALQILSKDAK